MIEVINLNFWLDMETIYCFKYLLINERQELVVYKNWVDQFKYYDQSQRRFFVICCFEFYQHNLPIKNQWLELRCSCYFAGDQYPEVFRVYNWKKREIDPQQSSNCILIQVTGFWLVNYVDKIRSNK